MLNPLLSSILVFRIACENNGRYEKAFFAFGNEK